MALGNHRRATYRVALLSSGLLLGLGCTPVSPAQRSADTPAASRPASAPAPPDTTTPADPCPHGEGEDAQLFAFEDFGPPAMAHEIVGQAWWQWDAEGHAFESEAGTVWVVVHEVNVDPAELAARFPVRETDLCDHRYVSVDRAVEYLDAHIRELHGVDGFEPLRARLLETREAIAEHFSDAR